MKNNKNGLISLASYIVTLLAVYSTFALQPSYGPTPVWTTYLLLAGLAFFIIGIVFCIRSIAKKESKTLIFALVAITLIFVIVAITSPSWIWAV